MPFISTIGGGSAQGFGRSVSQEIFPFAAASTTQSTDTTYTIGGIEYQSHTWLQANQSGNSITFTSSSGNGHVNADVLLIAGGGGGGGTQNTGSNGYGGGGGAGGVIIRSGYNFSLAQYDISVGAGGAGNTGNSSGTNGTNSTIDLNGGSTVLASYGGGGGGWTNDRDQQGNSTTQKSTPGDGGSTGGAGGGDYQGYTDGGQGNLYGQGHRGGRGTGNVQGDYGGSGGGANAGGADGTDNIGMVNQFDTSTTEGADSRGLGNAYRNGGIVKYAGGGNGYYSGIQGTNYGGGNGQSGASGLAGTANTGGGGGGGTAGTGGGAGGSGICVIRYPIALVDTSSDMSQLQSLSAGTNTIATTNGTGSLSLTVVDYNGRKWAKIPWGTETSGGIDGGHWFSNDLFSVHTYGNSNKGISMDSSNRWRSGFCNVTADNNTNQMTSSVIFHFGIRYRYIKTYVTGIRSYTSNSVGKLNCDWGAENGNAGHFADDLGGGHGDHPGWIIGWDFNGDEPRYKQISGNTSSAGWIGGSGGWTGGEAGDVTRSFTADIHDCGVDSRGDGLYKHDKAGLLASGGSQEFYRHNSGYFLIS